MPCWAGFGTRLDDLFVLQTAALLKPSFRGINFMNKTDIVDAVAQATDTSKADASNAVDAVFDTITGALKGGDGVQLIRFGISALPIGLPVKAATPAPERPFRLQLPSSLSSRLARR